MQHFLNFGLHDSPNGSREASLTGILGVSRGAVRFGESGRAWSGLRKEPARFEFDGRVAIQRFLRIGRTSEGKLVPLDLLAPEFVSERRAQFLVSTFQAKYCGQVAE